MPDAVYHVKNGSNLHKHVNDSAVNNQFASRLYISSPADLQDEQNKSKIYICDLNLNYFEFLNNFIKLAMSIFHTFA